MTTTGKLQIGTHGENEVLVTREFDAPRELVWDAMTKPELLKRWLWGPEGHTLPLCEMDVRPGGKLRYVWRLPDGNEMGMSGVFREVQRPERMVHTEVFDQDWTGGEALVTLVLEERAGRTRMTMTIQYASAEVRDMVLKTGMAEGMEASYARLDGLLPSFA